MTNTQPHGNEVTPVFSVPGKPRGWFRFADGEEFFVGHQYAYLDVSHDKTDFSGIAPGTVVRSAHGFFVVRGDTPSPCVETQAVRRARMAEKGQWR